MCAGIVWVRPQFAHRCVFDFHIAPFEQQVARGVSENWANKNSDNSDAERFCQTYCRTFWALKTAEISRPVGTFPTRLFAKIVLQARAPTPRQTFCRVLKIQI